MITLKTKTNLATLIAELINNLEFEDTDSKEKQEDENNQQNESSIRK